MRWPIETPGRPSCPPWLWIWAGALVLLVPQVIENYIAAIDHLFDITSSGFPLAAPLWASALLLIAFDAAPIVLFLSGIVAALFAGRLGRRLAARFELAPPRAGSLDEIADFLAVYAPGVALRANLRRMIVSPRIYPLSSFRGAVAVFGGFARLWRRDRPTAEAILLHEVSHLRNGDAPIIRIGAGLPRALALLPLTFGAFTLALVVSEIVWGEEFEALEPALGAYAAGVGAPPPEGLWGGVALLLENVVWMAAPTLWMTLLNAFVWFTAIAFIPVAAVWTMEIAADRFVSSEPGLRKALEKALSAERSGQAWGGRALDLLAHPPVALRRALIRRDGVSAMVCASAVPLAYPVSAVLTLSVAWATSTARGVTDQPWPVWIAEKFPFLISDLRNQLLFIGATLLLWPLIAPTFSRLATGLRVMASRRDAGIFATVGTALLIYAAGLDPQAPVPGTRAAADEPAAVEEVGPRLEADRGSYSPGDVITLSYSGLPPSPENWIGLSPPDKPVGWYDGSEGGSTWDYAPTAEGSVTLTAPPEGPCVARLYVGVGDDSYVLAHSVSIIVVE